MHNQIRYLVSALVFALTTAVVLVVVQPAGLAQPNYAWLDQFGSVDHDAATAVAVDTAGNVYVAGWTAGALPTQRFAGGARDVFLRKDNANGRTLWTTQFGTLLTDTATDVTVDAVGNAYLAGQTNGALTGQPSSGGTDGFVRKVHSTGAEVWTIQIAATGAGPAAAVAPASLRVDGTGNLYVAGAVLGALPGQARVSQTDAFLIKYDPNAQLVWVRQFGSPEATNTRALSIALGGSADADVYVVSLVDGEDAVLQRFDATGNLLHTQQLAIPGAHETVLDAVPDGRGYVYTVGREGHDAAPVVLRKYTPAGVEAWSRPLGNSETNTPTSVTVDTAGNIYVAGESGQPSPSGGSPNVFHPYVRKFGPDGSAGQILTLGSSQLDLAAELAADASSLYLAGWTNGSLAGHRPSGASDAFAAKITKDLLS